MITTASRVTVMVCCLLVVSSCGFGSDDSSSDPDPDGATETTGTSSVDDASDGDDALDGDAASTPAAAGDAGCVAPDDGGELLDQDFDDSQLPWERKGADRVPIFFESGDVTEEYRDHLEQGAAAWNKSPCLDAQVVERCPEDSNCVTVSLTRGDDADGNFDARERDGYTVGGHIDLYVEELDQQGDGAKLNVTIHEMGHAVGLRHRLTERVLMNGDTYTDIFDPDETDFHNLLVLYGNQA